MFPDCGIVVNFKTRNDPIFRTLKVGKLLNNKRWMLRESFQNAGIVFRTVQRNHNKHVRLVLRNMFRTAREQLNAL